jgi:hypothetical protein
VLKAARYRKVWRGVEFVPAPTANTHLK